jgi:acetoin:2,6-dichlorophenolindophenol oxidoreductase subunit alpha
MSIDDEDLVAFLYELCRIRTFEEEVERLNRTGRIPGFLHTSIGQEAVAVGICSALSPTDYVLSTHRGHGHCLAKGADMARLMAELYGKADGQNRGKGGSMHVSDFAVNMIGANGIVGANLTIAVGAGLSAKRRGTDQVAVAFFGEGAATNGAFHEALNLAAVLTVPVLFVCENNLYAHEAPVNEILAKPSVAAGVDSYGIRSWIVDGNDVLAVSATAREAVAHCRSGPSPALIEARTYRQRGHHGGDRGRHYRPADEIQSWLDRDPISVLRAAAITRGVSVEELDAAASRASADVAAAIEAAEASEYPDAADAFVDLYAGDPEEAVW